MGFTFHTPVTECVFPCVFFLTSVKVLSDIRCAAGGYKWNAADRDPIHIYAIIHAIVAGDSRGDYCLWGGYQPFFFKYKRRSDFLLMQKLGNGKQKIIPTFCIYKKSDRFFLLSSNKIGPISFIYTQILVHFLFIYKKSFLFFCIQKIGSFFVYTKNRTYFVYTKKSVQTENRTDFMYIQKIGVNKKIGQNFLYTKK